MIKTTLIVLFIALSFPSFAKKYKNEKLLDKVLAVYNDRVFTMSMVKRVKSSIKQRAVISKQIYGDLQASDKAVIDHLIKQELIKSGLNNNGVIILDEHVESAIQGTQNRSGITRKQLVKDLKQYGIQFDEYFELIRSTIEYNEFINRIIRPLVSVTEQAVRNEFFKIYGSGLSSFQVDLVQFSIPNSAMAKKNLKNMKADLKKYQESGNLPAYMKGLGVSADELNKNLKSTLIKVPENEFSNPVPLNDSYKLFFVKKKDVSDSVAFKENKEKVKGQLIGKELVRMVDVWVERERNKHFIKILL
jgi:peptidyl-prolyl cis-trans isomerase SurA